MLHAIIHCWPPHRAIRTGRLTTVYYVVSLVKLCPDLWIPSGAWRAQILGISHIKPISAFAANLQ